MSTISEISLIGKKALGFTMYDQIKDVDFPQHKPVDPEDEKKSPDDIIFDEIFSVDPITLLPDGDIACFMSENTSDSVRSFISQNLLRENGSLSDTTKFEGLSDDVIAEFTRGGDETIESYRSRLVDYVRNNSQSR